jgi:methylmalonyl-CoA/ethylmalonyl-CoA epimerase
MRFDHLGIAVRSLDRAVPRWEASLGRKAGGPEEVSGQGVRVCFLDTGAGALEFLEPSRPDSPVARFLDRRGEGLHHVAFAVTDLRAKLVELEGLGIRLIDREPRRGARGHQVAFAHPEGFGGVLTELVQPGEGSP